jgi:hypothetical protein
MPGANQSECRLARLASLCSLFLATAALEAAADESPGQISSTEITRYVVSALPKPEGRSANVVANLDLTGAFDTRTPWAFVAAILPGSHFDGGEAGPVDGGALAQCFVNNREPHCVYGRPKNDFDWFSTPIELYSGAVVFRGANKTDPLVMITAGSAHGGNGSHSIFTELFAYDRRLDKFRSVFSNATGSNNNQKTRFMEEGPLRGDVIVDEPSGCCYWVEVYRPGGSGRYARILGYRSHTVYGDRNPLSVSDSEMPEILRRLGLWHPGDALPIPHEGCKPVMRRREEWCQ